MSFKTLNKTNKNIKAAIKKSTCSYERINKIKSFIKKTKEEKKVTWNKSFNNISSELLRIFCNDNYNISTNITKSYYYSI